jgi:hypothetical protein
MATARPEPSGLALRLALVRTLAWALLIGGWLVLGALGRQHLPLLAGGQAPVALWLVTMAGGLALLKDRRLSMPTLRMALAGAGGVAAAALLALNHRSGPAGGWVLLASGAWGVLLLGASFCVQALRRAGTQRPPAPFSAAVAGAALSWAVAGDLVAVSRSADGVALAVLVAALAAALAPHGVKAVSACRAGLFDCALHLPGWRPWRDPAQWPHLAAALVMLPMMAALSRMSEWCGADDGMALSAPATVALHLGAMLLPAWGLNFTLRHGPQAAGLPAAVSPKLLRAGVALAMLASGPVLLIWPGFAGLMAASLWQAVAWSLAWCLSMQALPVPQRPTPPPASPPASLWGFVGRIVPLAASGGAVLALGVAMDAAGPDALATVHATLAALAMAGAAWPLMRDRPVTPPTQEHPT